MKLYLLLLIYPVALLEAGYARVVRLTRECNVGFIFTASAVYEVSILIFLLMHQNRADQSLSYNRLSYCVCRPSCSCPCCCYFSSFWLNSINRYLTIDYPPLQPASLVVLVVVPVAFCCCPCCCYCCCCRCSLPQLTQTIELWLGPVLESVRCAYCFCHLCNTKQIILYMS